MNNRLFVTLVTTVILVAATSGVIFYARGFQFNQEKKTLESTGILAVKSEPDGASVFINGKLLTATNQTLNFTPGNYEVKIQKEGFHSWQKKYILKNEVVFEAYPTLFPALISTAPFVYFPVKEVQINADNLKLYFLGTRSLTRDDSPSLPASPSGQVTLTKTDYYSLDLTPVLPPLSLLARSPQTISKSLLEQELEEAELRAKTQLKEKISRLSKELLIVVESRISTPSFSLDDRKIFYTATMAGEIPLITKPPLPGSNPTAENRKIESGKTYVYDIKEDRNYLLPVSFTASSSGIPRLQWLNSKNLLLIQPNKIEIMDFDGANRFVFYDQPFVWATPLPDASKLIILKPDGYLYSVNLK